MDLKKFTDLAKHREKLAEEIYTSIMRQREQILKAFIAETGCKPSECEQVEQRSIAGTIWYVRKKNNIAGGDMRKGICNERKCNWKGSESDILTAPNPFELSETINGCPSCKDINTIVYACDEPDCWEEVTCGTSTPQGYRSTCGKHKPS